MARSQMQMAQTRRLYNYGLPLLRHKQCFGCCWQYLKSKLLIIKIFLHSYLLTLYHFDVVDKPTAIDTAACGGLGVTPTVGLDADAGVLGNQGCVNIHFGM